MNKWKYKIKNISIEDSDIKFNFATRTYCKKPYPGHKHGCPNYGKNPLCPPNSVYLGFPKEYDIRKNYKTFILIILEFDFQNYIEQMKAEHRNWKNGKGIWQYRRLVNPLYWQGHLKKIFREYIETEYKNNMPGLILSPGSGFVLKGKKCQSMESSGIDVFKTLDSIIEKGESINYFKNPLKSIMDNDDPEKTSYGSVVINMCCLLAWEDWLWKLKK
jgi:predicted metal-binding protein